MAPSERSRFSRKLVALQMLLGCLAYVCFALPYARRARGLEVIQRRQRYLFVCNHVSLLDTFMLGAFLWRARHYPILVLGAKSAWCDNWVRTLLSRPLGFLLERGRLNPNRIRELEAYGRQIDRFSLVVFPEGTRGNGLELAECQPGIYHVAQAARAVMLPVFIKNMHRVSTKGGRFHPLAGWRQVEVCVGEPVRPEDYLALSREEFTAMVRRKIQEAGREAAVAPARGAITPLPSRPAAHLNRAPLP